MYVRPASRSPYQSDSLLLNSGSKHCTHSGDSIAYRESSHVQLQLSCFFKCRGCMYRRELFIRHTRNLLPLTFFDLLNGQHIVEDVGHEHRGVFHEDHRLLIATLQGPTALQQVDADAQRVQRTAQLVEDVLQKGSAGLVQPTRLRFCATVGLSQLIVTILQSLKVRK